MIPERPLKVFFVIDTLNTGGAEKSTLEIVARLSNDIQPYIITLYKGNDLLTTNKLPPHVVLKQLNLPGKYDFLKAVKGFSAICETDKPDLIVATLFRSEIVSRIVSKRLNIKNVGTFVNDTYSDFELSNLTYFQRVKINLFKIINKYTAKSCIGFLANAEAIKRSNARVLDIPLQKITVIHRGRNVQAFTADTNNRFNSEEIKFVNVGRLLQRKGQFELIKAFALFLKDYPQATLDIAGDGKFREPLMQLISELGIGESVRLLGSVQNIPLLLSSYDVFVFPSHYEGFSGAVVEAMLAGLPVIASDIEMNKEAITHLQTGYLFKVKNEQSILEAMLFAVKHKAEMKKMAELANEFARENFDIDIIAGKHERYYKKSIAAE